LGCAAFEYVAVWAAVEYDIVDELPDNLTYGVGCILGEVFRDREGGVVIGAGVTCGGDGNETDVDGVEVGGEDGGDDCLTKEFALCCACSTWRVIGTSGWSGCRGISGMGCICCMGRGCMPGKGGIVG
jgi:hypothetical protein